MTAIITGPRAYYNEYDEYAAAWLRNLIAAGVIAPGEVDTRSIEDVHPDDLVGFTQCHFFAGLGVWSYAMRSAGWTDDRPGWSASCPCQPYSSAGKGEGFADERHLWPAFYHLVGECRPARIVGEQVASKDSEPWIDLVHADLEALGYAFADIPFPSAGIGAPHIRDRNYWLAVAQGDAERARLERYRRHGTGSHEYRRQRAQQDGSAGQAGAAGIMAHAHVQRQHGWRAGEAGDGRDAARVESERLFDAGRMAKSFGSQRDGGADDGALLADRSARGRDEIAGDTERGGRIIGMADADADGTGLFPSSHAGIHRGEEGAGPRDGELERSGTTRIERPGPTNGHWRAADWLHCTDGKWRPVEPGTFPLVDGAAARVGRSGADWHTPAGKEGFGHRAGRLKGYGNAINAEQARIFMEIAMDCMP